MKTENKVGLSYGQRESRSYLWVALALSLVAVGCGGGAQEGAGDAGSEAEDVGQVAARVVNVEVMPVQPVAFTRTVRLTGAVRAMRDVVVSAEEAGVVRQVVLDKGNRIRAGQTIVRLGDEILQAQVQTARAQADLAREVWERRKRLYEEDKIGSELSYLEAKYASEQAQGTLKALEERLARTVVRAPIRGILEERLVEIGAVVGPGTPVARIVQIDTVKVWAGVPERYALGVVAGAAATVTFDLLEGDSFVGTVTYVGVAVDPDSRTFPIELTLANPGSQVKPETIAEITVVQEEMSGAIVVPRQALVTTEGGHVAFVIAGDGENAYAQRKPVEISVSQGNDVVIGTGVNEGDRLVVVGQQELTDGDQVRVVER